MKNKLVALLLGLLFSGLTFAQKQPKNILFLAVDDLKPLLNSYGFEEMHTPNFDRLAKMGVQFDNAHVQQAVCGPSRASIMTGVYPDRTKVWDLHTDFRKSAPDLVSMPEYLATQGYVTTGIGKIYHKGSSSPGHDGKSWTKGHVLPHDYPEGIDPPMINYQHPDTKAKMEALMAEAEAKGIKGGKRGYALKRLKPSTECADVPDAAYQDGLYTLEALKKLNMLAEQEKPFFLALGYQRPHLPFVAPKKYWDLYDRKKIDLAVFRELAKGTPRVAYHSFGELKSYTDIDNNVGVGEELPEEKQRELIHGYMAAVSYIDAQLGMVLDELEKLKLSDNTLIVLWGDHGFHLGDHALWCKHSNFEQATRIPLIFAGPGVAQNRRVKQPVELLDVFPTLFDLAGVAPSQQTQGISLVPLLDNDDKTTVEKDFAISQFRRDKDRMGYSIRTERYRYTEWHKNHYRSFKPYSEDNLIGTELYDYEKDPNETVNFSKGHSEYKDVLKEMKNRLHAFLQKKNDGLKPGMGASGQAVKPNILFIHVDDLGYHDMGHTGSRIYQTPNVDKLAKESRRFEQAYSSYPRCTPSRYGLMTGTYPVQENKGNLAEIPADQNAVKQFGAAGYQSFFVGKWHLGDGDSAPVGYGFDQSYAAGSAGGAASHFYPFNVNKKGKLAKEGKIIPDVEKDCQEGDYLADVLTSRTMDFIQNRDTEKPFFAMLSFYAVHTPLEAKSADRARNKKEIQAFDFGDGPEYIDEGAGRRKMRQDDPDYAGMVENMDENVGRLLKLLEELDLDENTIVVFSSDHGGLSNGGHKWERRLATTNLPLKAGKGWLYEGGIRVPLIMRWPGQLEPGVDQENIILGMDVLPTLLEFSTGKTLKGIDGKSAVAVMVGAESWKDRTVFWHSKKARPHSTGDPKTSAIRSGDYKLLYFFDEDRVELYNLAEDIGEQNDLSTENSEKAASLLKELKDWKKKHGI